MNDVPTDELLAELERLGKAFGRTAVRSAAQTLFQGRVGRKSIDDLKLAKRWLELESADWLAGGDLRARGRSRRIAVEVSKSSPGHDQSSTVARVGKKLQRARIPVAVLLAIPTLMSDWPYHAMIQKLDQARGMAPSILPLIDDLAEITAWWLLLHRALLGEPSAEMSLNAMIAAVDGIEFAGIGAGLIRDQKIQAYRIEHGVPRIWEEIARN